MNKVITLSVSVVGILHLPYVVKGSTVPALFLYLDAPSSFLLWDPGRTHPGRTHPAKWRAVLCDWSVSCCTKVGVSLVHHMDDDAPEVDSFSHKCCQALSLLPSSFEETASDQGYVPSHWARSHDRCLRHCIRFCGWPSRSAVCCDEYYVRTWLATKAITNWIVVIYV